MAEKQASWIQASSHPADTDRLVLEALLNPSGAPVSGAGLGVGTPAGDLLVTQNGSPNMSVNVAAGHAWIDGTESPTQGAYHVYNDAVKNLAISAAHATLARKDLIVARVQDAQYSGATNAWTLAVVTGTPAGSPAEPAVPANAIVLALVDVAAAASSITNANITDRRRRACGLSGIAVCTSATRPAAPYTGQVIYETDTDHPAVWDGTAWKQLGLKADGPAVRCYRTALQSIPNATKTAVSFNVGDRYDTDTMHDPAVNPTRITFNTPGVYDLGGCIAFAANAVGFRMAILRVGGSTELWADSRLAVPATDWTIVPVSTEWKFAAGEYAELVAYQTSGGALDVQGTGAVAMPEFWASFKCRG